MPLPGQGVKCVTCAVAVGSPNSNIEKDNSLNHSCVSPSSSISNRMGCLEYTYAKSKGSSQL